jgi:hypothetical protein
MGGSTTWQGLATSSILRSRPKIEDLRKKTTKVRGWVNKAVAHKDAAGREAPPFSELHASIDVVFELFNKYWQLIRGASTDTDVVMTPWAGVFRTQWISEMIGGRRSWKRSTGATSSLDEYPLGRWAGGIAPRPDPGSPSCFPCGPPRHDGTR